MVSWFLVCQGSAGSEVVEPQWVDGAGVATQRMCASLTSNVSAAAARSQRRCRAVRSGRKSAGSGGEYGDEGCADLGGDVVDRRGGELAVQVQAGQAVDQTGRNHTGLYVGGSFTPMETGTRNALYSIAVSASTMYLAGDNGTVLSKAR